MQTILYIFFIIGYALLFLMVLLIILSAFRRFFERRYVLADDFKPTVSLIVPAHNEEDVIERTIQAFLKTSYPESLKEIIIVNDGSIDKTEEKVRKYAYTIVENGEISRNDNNLNFKNVTLVNRGIGGNGKAHASNAGGKIAGGEILFFIDADVAVSSDIFEQGVKHMADPKVGGVAGYIEVARNKSILNDFISFESILSQKVVRAGFNGLGVQYIVPGGCAVFKKEIWNRVWGYTPGSFAEDTDITWKVLMETRKEIRFDDSVRVKADEPKTLLSLWNQRVRWARGNLEVTLSHWYKVGRSNFGKGATYIFPFWLASTLVPIVFILNAVGVLLGVFFHINLHIVFVLNSILGLSFFVSFIAGAIAGRGKSLLAGFLSPGLPLLIVLLSSVVFRDGLRGMLGFIGISSTPEMISIILVLWILSTIPCTYLMIKISKRHENIAQAIQLSILGYWSLVMTSSIHGYILEALGTEKKWIRTVR